MANSGIFMGSISTQKCYKGNNQVYVLRNVQNLLLFNIANANVKQ